MNYNEICKKAGKRLEKATQKAVLCVSSAGNTRRNITAGVNSTYIENAAFALEKAFRGENATGFRLEAVRQGYRIFEVQFNPNEISLDCSISSPSSSEKKKSINTVKSLLTRSSRTVMTIPLIFEDIIETDAFLGNMATTLLGRSITPENAVFAVAGAVKECSVKKQIDGLMSLISNETTRCVVFCWGDIALSGMIQSIQAEYNMFNPSGNPIMGKATLSIILNHGAEGSSEKKYWTDAFNSMFQS